MSLKVNMSKFPDRLKELRLELGLTQQQLADESGIPRTTIQYWEANLRIPNIEGVIVLADFFKVSIDYLVGRED